MDGRLHPAAKLGDRQDLAEGVHRVGCPSGRGCRPGLDLVSRSHRWMRPPARRRGPQKGSRICLQSPVESRSGPAGVGVALPMADLSAASRLRMPRRSLSATTTAAWTLLRPRVSFRSSHDGWETTGGWGHRRRSRLLEPRTPTSVLSQRSSPPPCVSRSVPSFQSAAERSVRSRWPSLSPPRTPCSWPFTKPRRAFSVRRDVFT